MDGETAPLASETARDGTSGLASLTRGTMVTLLGQILLVLLNFVGRVTAARVLNLEAWGAYNLGLAFAGLLSTVGLLGLPQAIARTIAYERNPASRRKTIFVGLVVAVASSVTVSVAVYLSASTLGMVFSNGSPGVLTTVLQIFAASIGFLLLSTFLAAVFQGFENAGPNAWFNNILNPLLFIGFLGAALVLGQGFIGVIWSYTLSCAATFGGIVAFTWVRLPRLIPRAATPTRGLVSRDLWTLTIAFWGVQTMTFVTQWIDTLVLGIYRGPGDVGSYSAAMSLARILTIGNSALMYIYLPVATRLLRNEDREGIRRSYVATTRWTVALAFPFLMIFLLLPSQSLTIVFGARYDIAAGSLVILAIGGFASALGGPTSGCQAAFAHTRTLLAASVASAGVTTAASFALIPTYGALGASVAWTLARIAFVAISVVSLFLLESVNPFVRSTLLPLAVALAVGVPVMLGLAMLHVPAWTVIPIACLTFLIFLGGVFLTRALSSADLEVWRMVQRMTGLKSARVDRVLARFMRTDAAHPLVP